MNYEDLPQHAKHSHTMFEDTIHGCYGKRQDLREELKWLIGEYLEWIELMNIWENEDLERKQREERFWAKQSRVINKDRQ